MARNTLSLSVEHRKRALGLLARGHSPFSAAEELRKRFHSDFSLFQVKRAYFPSGGAFYISHLVGRSMNEIEAAYQKMVERARKSRERKPTWTAASLEKLRKSARKAQERRKIVRARVEVPRKRMLKKLEDEKYRKIHAKRSRATMLALWKDPQYVAAHKARSRKRLLDLWQMPSMRRRMLGGLRRFRLAVLKVKAAKARASAGTYPEAVGYEGKPGTRIPLSVPDIEYTLDLHRAFTKGLFELQPLHRLLVSNALGVQIEHHPEVVSEAARLSQRERASELKAAYEQLAQHKLLKKLFE